MGSKFPKQIVCLLTSVCNIKILGVVVSHNDCLFGEGQFKQPLDNDSGHDSRSRLEANIRLTHHVCVSLCV